MEQKKITIYSSFPLLLLAAFISGGSVMSAELLSARLIAAYYGNSLYVWSAVMAITLAGLATGYFTGGALSTHTKKMSYLSFTLIAVAVLLLSMPFLSSLIMENTLALSLKAGIIISCSIFVFPPLFCFGMVSPLIIGIISEEINEPGSVAGTVYSISTIGGILFTFLTGYLFIPHFGLKATCYLVSAVLGLAVLLSFRKNKLKK